MCRIRVDYQIVLHFHMLPDASQEISSWEIYSNNLRDLFPYACSGKCDSTLVYKNYIITEKRGPCIFEARKTVEVHMNAKEVAWLRTEKDEHGYYESELQDVIPHYTDTILIRDYRDDYEHPSLRDRNHLPNSKCSWWEWILEFPDFRFSYPDRPAHYDEKIKCAEEERANRKEEEDWLTESS